VGGLSPISIAFVRVAAALPVLASLAGSGVVRGMRSTWRTALPAIAVLDLGGGSALFAYSAVEAGLGLTVIVLGVSSIASQLMSRALGQREADGEGVLGRRVDPSGHSHIVYIAWIRPARVDREAL
jgi:hypothetical protein